MAMAGVLCQLSFVGAREGYGGAGVDCSLFSVCVILEAEGRLKAVVVLKVRSVDAVVSGAW